MDIKLKLMTAEQMLETYISKHPEYWEFESEVKEVERLISLCNQTTSKTYAPIECIKMEMA